MQFRFHTEPSHPIGAQ